MSGDQGGSYVVTPEPDEISAMGVAFMFALMRLSGLVPGCPLIWGYYLFLGKLIILEERISSPIASYILAFMF